MAYGPEGLACEDEIYLVRTQNPCVFEVRLWSRVGGGTPLVHEVGTLDVTGNPSALGAFISDMKTGGFDVSIVDASEATACAP